MKKTVLSSGLVAIGALGLSACASLLAPSVTTERAEVRPGAYRLDPTHAAVLFRIDHLGYSAYLGRFETVDASLDFDPASPTGAVLEATVEISSLDIANDAFAAELVGPDWFDAEAHPQAVFRSTSITVTGDATGTVTGELTLKGVTQPVTFDVTFNGGARDLLRGAYVTGFSAKGVIDRTAFGVDRYAGLVASEVEIELQAEFIRQGDE